MANLAATYRELGRYQEAESLESIVLEKRKQLLSADHPDTLLAMGNLAATYCELGRSQEAEPLESIVLEKEAASRWTIHTHCWLWEIWLSHTVNLDGTKRQSTFKHNMTKLLAMIGTMLSSQLVNGSEYYL
ncbi:hypothetical protein B0H13DRAFT_1917173 [Mycena leptocephala]|nr:hypothetical protein B0H13DRAFT_1917173 [Mycena leptocephala]